MSGSQGLLRELVAKLCHLFSANGHHVPNCERCSLERLLDSLDAEMWDALATYTSSTELHSHISKLRKKYLGGEK